ncbi:hypothetical protein PR003_g7639 [Phytophthora rubi]|uniref:Uncharacterized protein n=1 Tax=Phytophthora rubi TaxID=129364 RepID=A0A6A4FDE0_9STRA|nr:hypothetical protein PR003_g7639 [Phytophthora rubi]
MRVHNALWVLAETKGNDRARKYAQNRKMACPSDRTQMDSKWLRGHGGTRLRKLWFSLPLEERVQLLKATPDSTFPETTNGVLDERLKRGRKRVKSRITNELSRKSAVRLESDTGFEEKQQTALELDATSAVRLGSISEDQRERRFQVPHQVSPLQVKTKEMLAGRSKYHKTASQEYLLKLQTNYDRGSLVGVIESTVQSVKHAIQLAWAEDRPRSANEAFEAVCSRVSDVFATAIGTSKFPPEPLSDSGTPSPSFAKARIDKAHSAYKASVMAIHDVCSSIGVGDGPDYTILNPDHAYLGKTEGIPRL